MSYPSISLHEVLTVVEREAAQSNNTALSDPEQRLLSYDLERQVLAFIDDLPLKQKAALIQRKLHGLPYDHIAESLQCSPEAARANVFQALKKIRTKLASPSYSSSVTRDRTIRSKANAQPSAGILRDSLWSIDEPHSGATSVKKT